MVDPYEIQYNSIQFRLLLKFKTRIVKYVMNPDFDLFCISFFFSWIISQTYLLVQTFFPLIIKQFKKKILFTIVYVLVNRLIVIKHVKRLAPKGQEYSRHS